MNFTVAEIIIIYSSIALFLGVIKLLLDHRRNEILEDTRQAVLLVYEEVQSLDESVKEGCNDIVWTVNDAIKGEVAEAEKEIKP